MLNFVLKPAALGAISAFFLAATDGIQAGDMVQRKSQAKTLRSETLHRREPVSLEPPSQLHLLERDFSDWPDNVLPLVRSTVISNNSPGRSLARRGHADLFTDCFTKVSIHEKDYTLAVLLGADGLIVWNPKDDKTVYDPATDPMATKLGPIKSIRDETGTEFKINAAVGDTALNDVSLVQAPPTNSDSSGETGTLGLGLPGSGVWKGRKAQVPMQLIAKFGVRATPYGDGSLTLGETHDDPVMTVPSALKDRWSVPIDIMGHKGVADLVFDSLFVIGPPNEVEAIFAKLGLTNTKVVSGEHIAIVPCKQPIKSIQFGVGSKGDTIEYEGNMTMLKDVNGGECIFFIKGIAQNSYPTAWTLGLTALYMPLVFDTNHGSPQITFAVSK